MHRGIRVLALSLTVLVLVGVCVGTVEAARPRTRSGPEIMIQTFGWNSMNAGSPGRWYPLIAQKADELGEMGFTLAWLPPVSRSVSPQGYMPGDYYDLGGPNSPTFYGNKDTLQGALLSLRKAGIKPLADIVVNHRCAGKQDGNGIWNQFVFSSGKAAWDQSAIVRGEYGGTGNGDSGDNFQPAPDLDLSNPTVQKDIVAWMNWLKGLGYEGWRYDFTKGYDPRFVAIFDKETKAGFSVSELFTEMSYSNGSSLNYDQNAHRQRLCDYMDRGGPLVTSFDVTTKGILQEAVKGEYWRLKDKDGKAPGLIGWWPARAVTFLDNHDTGSQQNLWPFPADKVMQGHAYILTHPGIPCVFWEHLYDWKLKEPIKKLMDIRKTFGITATSKLEILKAEEGLYVAVVAGRVAVKLGWKEWSPDASFKLQASGDQYAVWGK